VTSNGGYGQDFAVGHATAGAACREHPLQGNEIPSRVFGTPLTGHPAHQLDELLPWNWRPLPRVADRQAA